MGSVKSLALFDFDGTVTKKDSLLEFLLFSFGKVEVVLKLTAFLPLFFFYAILKKDRSLAKEKLTSFFFKGMEFNIFDKRCEQFSLEVLPSLIVSQAQKRLDWHLSENHEICIVSASYKNYLTPYFGSIGIKVIATELEVQEAILNGKFESTNCNGIEKVNRIKNRFDLSKYETIYAYGNSKGDLPMLDLANKKYYRPIELNKY